MVLAIHMKDMATRDYLTCYPDGFPYVNEVDPLTVEPTERVNPTTPDMGSGNNDFIFQVRYNNLDNLPPLPWRNWFSPRRNETGVVLYLDRVGTNDYKMFPMYPVSGTEGPGIYEHRFIPNDKEKPYDANGYTSFSNTDSLDCYISLDTGIYHYFFACSDDSTKYLDDISWPYECVTGNQPDKVEWGNAPDPYDSYPDSALDPRITRKIIGNSSLDREAHRIYSSKDTTGVDYWPHFEDTILLDRPTRAPGMFETNWRFQLQYPYSCNEYPKVTCLLSMQGDKLDYKDTHSIRFDDKRYGFGRFWGTLEPFYRSVNPTMAGCYKTVFDNDTSLSETSGTTTATDNVYRIMFKQLDGKAPTSIKVWITNTADGTGTATAYTMYPDPTKYTDVNKITPAQYKSGVWYNYKTKLPVGSHSYWFTANDGGQTAYWPNRPGTNDIFLPAVNNDFVPGPFVNTPSILSGAKVTPGTGKQGGKYVYSVTYKDPDGQRPNSAYVYIQTNDKGNVRKCSMLPVTPIKPNRRQFC